MSRRKEGGSQKSCSFLDGLQGAGGTGKENESLSSPCAPFRDMVKVKVKVKVQGKAEGGWHKHGLGFPSFVF